MNAFLYPSTTELIFFLETKKRPKRNIIICLMYWSLINNIMSPSTLPQQLLDVSHILTILSYVSKCIGIHYCRFLVTMTWLSGWDVIDCVYKDEREFSCNQLLAHTWCTWKYLKVADCNFVANTHHWNIAHTCFLFKL